MSWLTRSISVFDGVRATGPIEQITLGEMLTRIQDGTYASQIQGLRTLRAQDEGAYKLQKTHLHAFTPAGVFTPRRAKTHLREASGLVHFDFDHPPNLAEAKATFAQDPWIVYTFVSPSGDGLKAAVWANGIGDDTTYKHAWGTVLAYFERTYPNLAVANDQQCKDISRLCFVSHDPELHSNPDALLYAVPRYQAPAPNAKAPRTTDTPKPQAQTTGAGEQARVEEALQVIPADDYDTWLRVGMALHSSGETWARAVWDTWSQRSAKYDPTTQEEKWASFTPEGGVTLGTIFHEAAQYGYTPPRPSLAVGQQQQSGAPPRQTTPPTAAGATAGATAAQWGTPGQQAPAPRPDIIIGPEIADIADAAEDALLHLPGAPIVYQRARGLCVIAYGADAPKWLHRPEDVPIAMDASTAYLRELVSRAALWWKLDKRTKKYEQALPPPWVVDTLQGRVSWPFPSLEGIVYSPTIRPDGSVLDTPGYDRDTGLFLDTNGTTFPLIPSRPTLDDARTAIGRLQEAVKDFPFADTWHFSATLAAMLSLVCRFAVMGNVPLFAIRANIRGSGKGLLADVVSLIGTGRAAPRWPQVTEDEEERKRLLTVALAGYPCLHIDNVTKPLGSPALDLALTAPSFSDRILGKHESREAPLSMVWLASGNNMQFKGDTARRIVPIDLDPRMERPEERTNFTHSPLIPWVHQERPRLAVAALTIIKAYFTAGCPAQGITPMGSFEQWSDLVRQALVWTGEADPNEGRKDLEAESNPEYEQLAQLLQAWEVCYPIPQGRARSVAKTVKEVLADIAALKAMDKPPVTPGKPNTPNEYDALQEALGALDRYYDGKVLRPEGIGYKLRALQGRVIGTRRLVGMGQDRNKVGLWGLEAL